MYKPLLAVGLRRFVLLVALCYLDKLALVQRNGSYTQMLATSLSKRFDHITANTQALATIMRILPQIRLKHDGLSCK